jgi:hypothetical protein
VPLNRHRAKLQALEASRRRQTFTTGPGFVMANLRRCDGCRVPVTLASLEVFQDGPGGRERWLCRDCAERARRG